MFYNIRIEKIDDDFNAIFTAQSRVSQEMINECKNIDALEISMLELLKLFREKENELKEK
jgi:type II secretory pathway predicted ATPase ExeA